MSILILHVYLLKFYVYFKLYVVVEKQIESSLCCCLVYINNVKTKTSLMIKENFEFILYKKKTI